jgi:glycosyltransferase 2 family protein
VTNGRETGAADQEALAVLDALEPGRQEVVTDQVSLARRLRQPRTIISIVVPLVILVLVIVNVQAFDFQQLADAILSANLWLLLAAFLVYYVGFPLRGYRWSILLSGAGAPMRLRHATEILFISWQVNCLVPAKLGDVYRAYLARANFGWSLSLTLGTVFIERVFDLFAIATLGLAAGYWSFRSDLPPSVQVIFALGVAVVLLLALGLFTLRNFGRRLISRLPTPHRVLELYERFETGVFSIDRRRLPLIGVLTFLIWSTEGARLFLVIEALGFSDVHLGISGAFFVALAASLLTAIPLTPAGLGVVEAGVVGILTLVYGVSFTDATAIALVDRSISVLSVVVLGSVLYVVSPLTKARGMPPEPAV